jgi:peptidoglycan/xylan/chitin deacetylase (PgdA/CDA1 family)
MRKLLAAVVASTPLPELVLRCRARKRLTVLAYHRIGPLPDSSYPFDDEVISATPEEFSRELGYLRRHLDLLSVRDLLEAQGHPERLPARPAIITFDDGYRDNHEIACPILKEHGLSACFFLSTQLVGTATIPWWDQVACCMKFSRRPRIVSPFGANDAPFFTGRSAAQRSTRRFLRSMKRLPWSAALRSLDVLREATGVDPGEHADAALFMSWDAARSMHSSGMDLGGHTRRHPVVSRLEEIGQVRDEVHGCYQDLEREIGVKPVAFAYPVGSAEAMSAGADTEVAAAGFRLLFSYQHAYAKIRPAIHRIPRLHTEYGKDHRSFRLGLAFAPGGRALESNRCPRPPSGGHKGGPVAAEEGDGSRAASQTSAAEATACGFLSSRGAGTTVRCISGRLCAEQIWASSVPIRRRSLAARQAE